MFNIPRGQIYGPLPPNRRPDLVATLMVEAELHGGWFLANRNKPRFYVLNLERVLTELAVNYTNMAPFMEAAKELIEKQTSWKSQYGFEFICSKTQLKPDKRYEAKLFDRAATLVVALELFAQANRPEYNVYDFLRIVPATFFVDGFRRRKFAELEAFYAAQPATARVALLGEHATADFEASLLRSIDQEKSPKLLQKMTTGHTVTKWVCDELRRVVANSFPAELHLGETLNAGVAEVTPPQDDEKALGNQSAAPTLRVPRRREPDELPTCY